MSGTNSCANYVQNRAGPAIIERSTGIDVTCEMDQVDFVSSFDGFVLEDDASRQAFKQELYSLSDKKLSEFKRVLERFSEMLQTRKAFSRLGVPMREPRDFDLDYVLSIATLISERREESVNARTCKTFVRKCCKTAVKHKDAVRGLISIAPTDVYGCLITGGFTVILAAVESHEKLRVDIQETLAKIPAKLSKVHRISGIQVKRDELHKCADAVFISIFTVLERIIERLSRNWTEKLTSKFKSNGGDIKEAFQALDDSIAEFNDEAEICAQLRLGRVEENGKAVKEVVDSIKTLLDGAKMTFDEASLKQDSMEGRILKAVLDSTSAVKEDNTVLRKQLVGVLNILYPFIASNPAFNCVNGTVNREYLSQNEGLRQVSNGQPSHESLAQETQTMIATWLQDLGEFDPSSDGHVTKCLDHASSLETKEQDQAQYIMNSKSFQDWLARPVTSLLEIRAETAPQNLISFMSLSTAMLALTLSGSTNFAVLSFFCGLRKSASYKEEDSGVLGILKSLNGQLLKLILAKQPSTRLPTQSMDKVWRKSGKEPKYAKALFKQLLSLLPDGSVVFVLLDSVSRVFGDKARMDKLVEMILSVTDQQVGHIVIKMLVTDPLASSRIKTLAHHSVYVPDDVDGWECGINMTLVEQSNRGKLRSLEKRKDLTRQTSSEEDPDSDDTESDGNI